MSSTRTPVGAQVPRQGQDRPHTFPRRARRVGPVFSQNEYAEVAAAAHRAGLTPSGYVAEATLAAVQAATPQAQQDVCGSTRTELARLQRDLFAARTAINQLATGLADCTSTATRNRRSSTINHCNQSLSQLDHVVSTTDDLLQRNPAPTTPASVRKRR